MAIDLDILKRARDIDGINNKPTISGVDAGVLERARKIDTNMAAPDSYVLLPNLTGVKNVNTGQVIPREKLNLQQRIAYRNLLRNKMEAEKKAGFSGTSVLGETIRNEGKLLGGLAKGVWGIAKSIPGSLLSAAKHPYETAVGVAEEAALKPTAYITKEVGNLTGLQKIKQLAEREKQGLGGIEQYIYNTPEKKRAANVGEFLGWMLPYSAAEKAIGMIPKIEKLGKLAPIVKDLGAWISTDQLLYNPDTDGSRAKQVLEDLAAFGVLKGAGKLYRAIKGKVAVDLADRFVKPVEEAMKKGGKVPIETAEEATNKAKRIIKAGTGKEPKQLVKEEVIPKVAPEIVKKPTLSEKGIKTLPKEKPPVETKIPKELEPLAKEARKYKSVEEFIKEVNKKDFGKLVTQKTKLRFEKVNPSNVIQDNIKLPFGYKGFAVKSGDLINVYDKRTGQLLGKSGTLLSDIKTATKKAIIDAKNNMKRHRQERITNFLDKQLKSPTDGNYIYYNKISDKNLESFYNQATKQPIEKVTTKIPKELEPLAKEARKYDTFIEYEKNVIPKNIKLLERKKYLDAWRLVKQQVIKNGVKKPKDFNKTIKDALFHFVDNRKYKAINKPLYRGISKEGGTGGADCGKGLYFTTNKKIATQYAKNGKLIEISRNFLPQKPLRFKNSTDYQGFISEIKHLLGVRSLENKFSDIGKVIRALGDYDGVIIGNGDIIVKYRSGAEKLSKSQLKSFYTQAIKQPVEKEVKEKLPEFPTKEKTIKLQAATIPGLSEFIDKDIAPKIRGIKNFGVKVRETLRNTFTPEANSVRAKKVDAELASRIMDLERTKQVLWKISEKQRAWWDKVPEETRYNYLDLIQKGRATKVNLLKLAKGDRKVARALQEMIKQDRIAYDDVYKRETELGIRMNYQNNYLPQIWKDVKKAKAFFSKYAESLGKDRFAKKKVIPLISVGREAGLELKTSNPIELRLMRQFDGERAIMRQQFINKLVDEGIAEKYTQGMALGDRSLVDAPDGHRYVVESDVVPLLKNAIFSPSLWSSKGVGGDIFRAVMRAKNIVVPIKLGLSLFHPIHILGIDQSSRATNALGGIIRGGLSWKEGIKRLIKANTSYTQKDALKIGLDIERAWDKPVKDLTDYEATAIKYIVEGGGTPKMSDVWRIKAIDSFKKAVREGNYPGATLRGIPALIESYQKPIFENWIPALKIASYLDAVEIKLREMPELVDNETLRKIELRKIWKSVDNRYGQLVYKTLFWKPFVKEVGMGSSLSMGWNLGFFREFGGGAIDTREFFKALAKKAKGEHILLRKYITDRMLFSADYTIRGMIIGGLITYALTGKTPKDLLDFVFPRSDNKGHRLNTPWYTREWFSVWNHWKKQGLFSGTTQYFANKANPMIMPLVRAWNNKDYFGYEIKNENDPRIKQLEDILKYLTEEELLPISATSYQRARREMPKEKALITSFAGYTPAPKYISETPIQSKIYSIYSKRFGGGIRTKSQKEKSLIKSEIRNLYLQGKTKEANQKLKEAVKKGIIKQVGRFVKDSDLPSDIRAFRALPAEDQRGLISKMSVKDINRYAWYVKKALKPKFSSISKNTRLWVQMWKSKKVKEPVWKRGKLVK